jgi:hypothetical protein
MTAPEIERQERLQVTAADGTTHRFYTHDEVQAAIAAAMMRAVEYCDRLSEKAYENGEEAKGIYLSCISAGVGDMIPTDATAALEERDKHVWNEALEAVLRLPYRIGPSLDADDGFFINVGQIKALLKRDAIRAMKKGDT